MNHFRIFLLCALLAISFAFQQPKYSRRTSFVVLRESTEDKTQEAPKEPVKCPDCDMCDGSGRISGGIGAVLDWWPIKAYRPCPNFIERGGNYQRSGQGLDEIAFGRDSTFNPKDYLNN